VVSILVERAPITMEKMISTGEMSMNSMEKEVWESAQNKQV
jgi:hypothetical protein